MFYCYNFTVFNKFLIWDVWYFRITFWIFSDTCKEGAKCGDKCTCGDECQCGDDGGIHFFLNFKQNNQLKHTLKNIARILKIVIKPQITANISAIILF